MTSGRQGVRADLVERVRRVIAAEAERLRTHLVDDNALVVITALSDEDIENLVLEALRIAEGPVSWRELKAIFQGIVGEDRLRKILSKLKSEGVIVELTKTRYSLPEYIGPELLEKVKNPAALRRLAEYTYS